MELSKERLINIVECAEQVISALNGTNEDVNKNDDGKMCCLWDELNDRFAPPEVVREMARRLLAAEEQQPFGYYSAEVPTILEQQGHANISRECAGEYRMPLYLHPQQGKAVQVPDDESESEIKWRDLALQFDGHRMQSLCFLKCILSQLLETEFLEAREFLKAGPLPGEEVLRNRITAMLEPVSNRDKLLFIAEKLVNRYLINKDSENESIACVAVSKTTIGTSGVWDDWKALDAALKAHRRASNTD